MARYHVDGVVLDTALAQKSWDEDTRWNGNNHISVATGDQWLHERLHLSKKGRFWIESWSQWQGSTPGARIVSDKEAATWLLANGEELPEQLAHLAEEVTE